MHRLITWLLEFVASVAIKKSINNKPRSMVKVDEEQQCRHSWSIESIKESVLSSTFAVTAQIRRQWTRQHVFVVKHVGAH